MNGPIDINLLVDQMFKDIEELYHINPKDIAYHYLNSAYNSGLEDSKQETDI